MRCNKQDMYHQDNKNQPYKRIAYNKNSKQGANKVSLCTRKEPRSKEIAIDAYMVQRQTTQTIEDDSHLRC